jgi:hypothetical protein
MSIGSIIGASIRNSESFANDDEPGVLPPTQNLPRWTPPHQKDSLRHRHFLNSPEDSPEVSATETLPCPAQQPDLNKWSGKYTRYTPRFI